MGDGFAIEIDAVRAMGQELVASTDDVLIAAGDIPEADAGIMSVVIELGVSRILYASLGYSVRIERIGQRMILAAARYHQADNEAQEAFARTAQGLSPEQAHQQAMADDDPAWATVPQSVYDAAGPAPSMPAPSSRPPGLGLDAGSWGMTPEQAYRHDQLNSLARAGEDDVARH